ncbi:19315_t:CDS:2, partial [Funneliformis geosporum]
HYEDLLKQLPPFVKKDVWLRLTTRKNNPLSKELELLTREVNKYFRKRDCQKIKIEANTASNNSSTLFRLDGFEKQLEESEALLRQKKNNIKKTIEAQVDEERKCLKDEYDALKNHLEGEYNKCMIDMK